MSLVMVGVNRDFCVHTGSSESVRVARVSKSAIPWFFSADVSPLQAYAIG